jgi:GGDEF domain-containing protein
MDGLKAINDSHGHAEGNDALRRLALVLGSSLRPEDEMARVGGDEFAVLTVLARNDEAAALAAKLEAAMARQESPITFGWAVYPGGWRERALPVPGRRRAALCAEARAGRVPRTQPVHRRRLVA